MENSELDILGVLLLVVALIDTANVRQYSNGCTAFGGVLFKQAAAKDKE